jgi:hypothetical protein
MLYLVCHNELVSLITVGVGLYQKLSRNKTLLELAHYGIQDTTYKWIKAFLSNRKQHALVDGATSDRANVVSGVPQGTVLGPLLFMMLHLSGWKDILHVFSHSSNAIISFWSSRLSKT